MKQQIKKGTIFGIATCISIVLFGIVYAAWNDTVSSGDPLTSQRWNDLVAQVESIGAGAGGVIVQDAGLNAVGINHTPATDYYQLDVRSATGAFMRIVSMNNLEAGIELVRVSGGAGDHALVNKGAALYFRTKDSSPWIDRSVVHQSGQFHIGTVDKSSSDAQLVVQTSGVQDILKLYETSGTEVLTVRESGSVVVSDLAGSHSGGSAYVCVDNLGVIYASESACP